MANEDQVGPASIIKVYHVVMEHHWGPQGQDVYCKPSNQNGTCVHQAMPAPRGFPNGWLHKKGTEAAPSQDSNKPAIGEAVWAREHDATPDVAKGIRVKKPTGKG